MQFITVIRMQSTCCLFNKHFRNLSKHRLYFLLKLFPKCIELHIWKKLYSKWNFPMLSICLMHIKLNLHFFIKIASANYIIHTHMTLKYSLWFSRGTKRGSSLFTFYLSTSLPAHEVSNYSLYQVYLKISKLQLCNNVRFKLKEFITLSR